jgi:hypothetical protein
MRVFCAVVLAACGLAKPLPPFEEYAHQLSDGTVALYWNCSRPSAGMVRMGGWANSPFLASPLKDLDFILYGVNAQDGSVSWAKANAQSYLIQTNQPAAFTIDLQTVGGEVRYDLVYEYWGGQGGGRSGEGGGGGARAQNMARDVCTGLAP